MPPTKVYPRAVLFSKTSSDSSEGRRPTGTLRHLPSTSCHIKPLAQHWLLNLCQACTISAQPTAGGGRHRLVSGHDLVDNVSFPRRQDLQKQKHPPSRPLGPPPATLDELAPCAADPVHLPRGRRMRLLPSSLLWLSESANPETASLHSLAQSFLTAPTYQGSASSGSYLLFPRSGQGWPLALRPRGRTSLFTAGWLQSTRLKVVPWPCPLALSDREERSVEPKRL